MNRLQTIKNNGRFLNCNDCNFVYLPLNEYTKHNCPKCQPNLDDEIYLKTEEKTVEEINHDGNEFNIPLWVRGE